MSLCLNSQSGGGHENPPTAVSCHQCEFLVQGAEIGAYEVISLIGMGSYSLVYEVHESAPLSRTLALKVQRFDQFDEKTRRQSNFFDEARRIADLQDPHIMPVYNFGHLEDERPYLVMEYAPHAINDLFRRADGTQRQAFAEELVPYLQQAAEALYYVHSNGLVHQDVKPGNLLIGRNGQLLLSDFGTTFYIGTQTHASLLEVTGTAAYMAPEQWQGHPRRDSDQYALAICCYELLTGRTPFVFKEIEEMWHAHTNELPPSPQQWNPRIPSEVAAVLLRAMAKDHRQRYPHILKFAESYASAVQLALHRYVCQRCGHQNRSGAQRCSGCGSEYDHRICPYCDASVRFGQRCCAECGRLTLPPTMQFRSPLAGVSILQGRYVIEHTLKHGEETRMIVVIARDTHDHGQRVVIKRWECAEFPPVRCASEQAYYEKATEPFMHLHHPFIPSVLDRFPEGKYYYMVLTYIDGESLEERLQKLLKPLPEHDVIRYMYALLNVLTALEQQRPPLHHYDIAPSHIIIEGEHGRSKLTGFQVAPPPEPDTQYSINSLATRKLALSPYLPIKDAPYDQRTCIYSLAACMHHVLTNYPPPHYPSYPPVRLLNPAISPELEAILALCLMEDSATRYQSYAEVSGDIKNLL